MQPRWGLESSMETAQGSSFLAILGRTTQSFWDWKLGQPKRLAD
jgi:nitrate reductase alpha subunit